ncbi:hypothetical protein KUCAC02_001548, partial [Chaenocephalus aceratus]
HLGTAYLNTCSNLKRRAVFFTPPEGDNHSQPELWLHSPLIHHQSYLSAGTIAAAQNHSLQTNSSTPTMHQDPLHPTVAASQLRKIDATVHAGALQWKGICIASGILKGGVVPWSTSVKYRYVMDCRDI